VAGPLDYLGRGDDGKQTGRPPRLQPNVGEWLYPIPRTFADDTLSDVSACWTPTPGGAYKVEAGGRR